MLDGSQELTLTRVLAASPAEVFAAWTTAESVRQWMSPDDAEVVFVELDVRVGGAFRIDMLSGGQRIVHHGVYREIIPPERLVFTWVSQQTHDQETLVRIELRPHGGQTELTLTQTRLPDPESVENHTRGWSQILGRLASHLNSP